MTALLMYGADNKNWIPMPPSIGDFYPGTPAPDDWKPAPAFMYFMSNSAPGGAGVMRFDAGALMPYLVKGSVKTVPNKDTEALAAEGAVSNLFNCPSDDADAFRPVYWGPIQVSASTKRNYSFSWNSQVRKQASDGGADKGWANRMTFIKGSSHKILFIEELAPNDGLCFIMQGDQDDEPAFRHGGAANYGFADGHAGRHFPSELGFRTTSGAASTRYQHTSIVNMAKCRYFLKLTKEQ